MQQFIINTEKIDHRKNIEKQKDDKTIPSLGGRWPFEHCTRDRPNLKKHQGRPRSND